MNIDKEITKLLAELHPKLGEIYKDSPFFQTFVKFAIVSFIPFLPTLWITANYGFWVGLISGVLIFLIKHTANYYWAYKSSMKAKKTKPKKKRKKKKEKVVT